MRFPQKTSENIGQCVGMLLYREKHSHLDLVGATRELTKANDGANPANYKELL